MTHHWIILIVWAAAHATAFTLAIRQPYHTDSKRNRD